MRATTLAATLVALAACVGNDADATSIKPAPTHGTSGVYYVDMTNGRDGGSGTQSSPWRTVEHARDAIRPALATATAEVLVQVAPGTEWLTSAIEFADADSGPDASYVRYHCTTIGGCHVNGGYVFDTSGCTVYSGAIYRCPYAGDHFYTMWEDGVRVPMARSPSRIVDATYPMSQTPYFNSVDPGDSATRVYYATADWLTVNPALDFSQMQVVVWPGSNGISWLQDTIPVTGINAISHYLILGGTMLLNVGRSRYYVQGDLQFLDAAGEWYPDVANHYLYYRPTSGTPSQHQIVIPTVNSAISFVGSSATAVAKNIAFDGFTFDYSNAPRIFESDPSYNPSNRMFSQVFMQNAANIKIINSRIRNSGLHGVYMHSAVTFSRVEKTEVSHTAGFGVWIENQTTTSPDIGDVNGWNVVTNIKILNVGELYEGCDGLQIRNSGHNLVDHIYLQDGPRAAINIYGDQSQSASFAKSYAIGNVVQYSRAYRFMQDSNDNGCFYTALTTHNENRWNQLSCDLVQPNATVATNLPVKGLYIDEQADNALVSHVNATNTKDGGFFNHSFGTVAPINVNGAGTFDPALMDPSIGVTADYPW
jgi:hypothetical protein